ncbi:hypothetical protein Tco_1123834, partial [Tanacetum coccineum]
MLTITLIESSASLDYSTFPESLKMQSCSEFFPFLIGSAKRRVDRLASGTINTWDLLKKAFIQRYCPPSMTVKQLEDLHNFKQEGDESLNQAWERYNDLLYKCPTHDINNHQKVGCQIYEGPHLDKDYPFNEEVKQVEEEIHADKILNSSSEQIKTVTSDQETSGLNKLHEVSFISGTAPLGIVENIMVKIDKFLFSFDFLILNNTPSETTILGRPFLATIHAEIDVFAEKISLGINEDRISFDIMRKDHNPSEIFFMVRTQSPGHSDDQIDYEESGNWDNRSPNLDDREPKKRKINLDENVPRAHFCNPIKQNIKEQTKIWPSCDPDKKMYDGEVEICGVSKTRSLRFCPSSEASSQESNKSRPKDYTFGEWALIKNLEAKRQLSRPARLIIMWMQELENDDEVGNLAMEPRCSCDEDVIAYLHGMDVRACLHGMDLIACLNGIDVIACLHGMDVIACLHGMNVIACLHGMNVIACLHGMDVIVCLQNIDVKLAFRAWMQELEDDDEVGNLAMEP